MIDTGDPRIMLTTEGHIALIAIARPDRLNALDLSMIRALERAAHIIDAMREMRVAIITGEGEKSFCAGGDVKEWSELSPEDFALQWIRVGHRAFDSLANLRQPLIAALNGHTLGGGLELAITADFRIAEDHVKLGQPETGLGILPGWSGTQRAVQKFGAQLVRRMALTGETFTAAEALQHGLIDQIVAKGQALAAAKALAEKILARGPTATQVTKALINAAETGNAGNTLEAGASGMAAASAELKEGVSAFKEKRKPQF